MDPAGSGHRSGLACPGVPVAMAVAKVEPELRLLVGYESIISNGLINGFINGFISGFINGFINGDEWDHEWIQMVMNGIIKE